MDPDDVRFQKIVMEGLVPKVAESAVAVSIVTNDEQYVDAQFCVELGVMIMLDKPIFAVVDPKVPVPDKLRRVADEICIADISTEDGRIEVGQRMQAFMAKHIKEDE